MRHFNLLKTIVGLVMLCSCTITRKIKIEQVSETTIANYYDEKNIPLSDIIRVKDVASYMRLSELGFAEIPKVIMFTYAGKQIDYEQIDYCVADPVEFIKGYGVSSEELKLKDFSLQGYLANFTPLTIGMAEFQEKIKEAGKNAVFVNTALYVDKFGMNRESFKLSEYNNKDFQIYYVNLDVLDTWQVENREAVKPYEKK